MKKDSKASKIFWYLIGIGVLIVFILVLVSTFINIGEKLREVGVWLEITFYVVASLLVFFLIINPIRIILFSPSLSIVTTLDKDSPKAHQTYRKVTKNILKYNVLTEEEKHLLQAYRNYDELRLALNQVYFGSVKKEIRKVIIKHASTVMLSTAISQNATLDMYAVITVNLDLIKEIVLCCGFRPSMKNLSKLSLRVASTALIADGLGSLKLEDILPQSAMNAVSSIPLLAPILASISQGLINALLSIRIGLVTRNYLFTDSTAATKAQIQAQAFGEAIVILPLVLAEVITFLPKKIIHFFSKKKEEKQEKDNKKDIVEGEAV